MIPVVKIGSSAVIWAPSSPSVGLYPRRLSRACAALTALGYPAVASPSAAGSLLAPYLEPESLAEEARDAALADSVGIVVATVGGWTSLALLPHLDLEILRAHPKAFVGYSDLTVLLNVVTRFSGMVTFLGPMALPEFGEYGGPWSLTKDSFRRAISTTRGQSWVLERPGEWTDERLPWETQDNRRRTGESHSDPFRTLRRGVGAGRLWGGSIRSLRLLAGTKYWPCPQGRSVLLLEDEGMSTDELFAHLVTLGWSGAFDECSAILFGRFSRPRANAVGFFGFDEVILKTVPSKIAVVAGLDFGHTEPKQTFPLGCWASVDANGRDAQITIFASEAP